MPVEGGAECAQSRDGQDAAGDTAEDDRGGVEEGRCCADDQYVEGAERELVELPAAQVDPVARPDRLREFLIGGVIGPITGPAVVIAGLHRGDDLVIVGRTVPLTPAQPAEPGAVVTPAKPGHPWPDEITSQRWSGKDSKKPLTKVEPLVVAEAAADAATQAGQVRHSMRFVRGPRSTPAW
ncbi:hypothetical protein OG558_24040 [Kribbella sp. NBC_01510]|uniref:hypothetical protein n=1 Tax=Kribbella sp. NBC_01510 TaxID=2903581 RepID=UPI0038683CB6